MGDNLLSWKEGVLSLFSSPLYWHYHTAQPCFRGENPARSSPCWTVRALLSHLLVSLLLAPMQSLKTLESSPKWRSCYQCAHQLPPPSGNMHTQFVEPELLSHPTGSWLDKHLYWLSSFLLTPYCSPHPHPPIGVSRCGLSGKLLAMSHDWFLGNLKLTKYVAKSTQWTLTRKLIKLK